MRAIDAAMQAADEPAAFGVRANQAGETGAAAQRGDVVCGVGRAAADHVRGVVLENQHGRFAGDPCDLTVDEFVRDEVADHEHAPARERIDEREQPFFPLRFAW